MSSSKIILACAALSACMATLALAQAPAAPATPATPANPPGTLEPQGGGAQGARGGGGRGGRGGGAIPADYRTGALLDTAPAGFDKARDGIEKGKLERVDYDAPAVAAGLKRWMEVYTPAGYSKDDKTKKYPVLILLHGIGGNEQHEWTRHTGDNGAADIVLDNLIADKKIVPMIVLFPNGNATATATPAGGAGGRGGAGAPGGRGGRGGAPGGAPGGAAPAGGAMGPFLEDGQLVFTGAPAGGPPAGGAPGAGGPPGGAPGAGGRGGGRGGGGGGIGGDGWGINFTNDLMKDILPNVEANYNVYKDRDHRAIAGLSMGGGQAINIGLTHMDDFAWIGGFSPAPNLMQAAQLVPDADATNKKISLLWIGCGDNDQTVGQGPYNLHKAIDQKKVNHIWYVDKGGHTMPVWKENLYLFSQKIFKPVEAPK